MNASDLPPTLADAQETIRALQEELAKTNQGLAVLNLELEKRIDERTAELVLAHQELKQTNSELMQLAMELEDRVARRTAELEAKNQTLRQQAIHLRESEERFRATFEQAAVGIAHVAPDGRWLRVNRKLCDIVGYTQAELLPLTFQHITHPDDLAADLGYVRQVLGGEIATYSMEKRYIRKDRSLIWINLTVSLVREPSGDPRYFIAVVEDITARKQAEAENRRLNEDLERRVADRTAQLEQANQELEAFSYSVSHDLRAPLRAIDGFSRILLREYAGALPEEARGLLQDVRANTQQMGRLVDDLLAFSRLSRQPIKKQPVAPAALVRQCLDELRGLQEGRRVQIGVAELAPCLGDPALLKQVWTNLLSNALKYTGKREVAVIEVGSRAGNGPGSPTASTWCATGPRRWSSCSAPTATPTAKLKTAPRWSCST
jgi:PAS domain S-box-containing protein